MNSSKGYRPPAEAYKTLWAKSEPYKQLLAHMIDTGTCARAYLQAASSRALLRFFSEQWSCTDDHSLAFVSYIAAMHDIGKAIPQFQMQDAKSWQYLISQCGKDYLPDVSLDPLRHEHASARIMRRIWKPYHLPAPVVDGYACVLSLHHQKMNHSHGIRRAQPFSEQWQEMQEQLERDVRMIFGAPDSPLVPEHIDAVCMLLTGLVILSDWVASSGPFDAETAFTDETYCDFSLSIAEQTMRRYGLIDGGVSTRIFRFQELWPHIEEMRDIQRKCEQLDEFSPITIIEAPMGEGKTEAALFLSEKMAGAWKKRGLYMALPTQATSNQMYGRICNMLKEIKGGHARLMHGMAFLQDTEKHIQSEDGIIAETWLSSLRMGLLDENGVGTVDQAMAGVLFSRFSVLRLLGLANKVLVIDELHAYDAYMSEIIQSLLQWCKALKIPVVLLSATLQDSQRRKYLSCFTDGEVCLSEAYPLITQVNHSGQMIQTTANATMQTVYDFIPVYLESDCDAIARFANQMIAEGGCYCILVNTVKKAQDVYRAILRTKGNDTDTLLFHARFPAGRREELEKECLIKFGRGKDCCRPEKAILVATQVVEQSLDIDFDGILTDIAPIDLLLQRAGRVHRHRNRIRPEKMKKSAVHVMMPNDCGNMNLEKRYSESGYVYAPFLLYNTEKLLEKGIAIRVPKDMREVIAAVYEQITESNWHVWQQQMFSQQLMQANAKGVTFPEPSCSFFFPAQSHPEFINMEVDDGFEPVSRASTRLGEPSVRIAFSNPEMLAKARGNMLTRDEQRDIVLSSVSLSLRHITEKDLLSSDLYRIEKNPLKGCYLSDKDDKITIGKYVLVNDPVLGVIWEDA